MKQQQEFDPINPRFRDIKPFSSWGNYSVDIFLKDLKYSLAYYQEEYQLDLNPDFQRGYVWTQKQKTSYVEFVLRGGQSSRVFLFNCPGWLSLKSNMKPMVLVDGKQRLSALTDFLDNKIPVFGCYFNQFQDKISHNYAFKFTINDLESRQEVLQWYLELNSGGTVHSEQDLDKVRKLLEAELSH